MSPGAAADAGTQTWWRHFGRKPLMNELPQRLDPLALGSERGIVAHPLLDFQGIGRIELAIQIGMDQQDRVIIRRRGGHGCFLSVRNDRLGILRSGLPPPGGRGAFDYTVTVGQLAFFVSTLPTNSKSPEMPLPTTLMLLSLFGECLNGISAGAAQHQYKHSAGDGQVLLEMQQLVSIGEICVKQNRGC